MTDDNIPDILYKYIDIEGGVSMLNTEQLWFTRAMSLNDPYDCYHTSNFTGDYNDFSVEFDYNEIFKSTGVCSLTDNPLNFLMWSYYNKHTGICVGIDIKTIKKLVGRHKQNQRYVALKKVNYQDKPPILDSYTIMPKNYLEVKDDPNLLQKVQITINNFLSTKAKWWEHENEYRLLLRELNASPEPAKARIAGLIKNVYIGCKCKKEDIDSVIKIAQSQKFAVYQLKLKSDTFGLEAAELYLPT